MPEALTAVITTIQDPTEAVGAFARRLSDVGSTLLVVGDEQGPGRYEQPGTEFLTFEDQLLLPFTLAPLLPSGHYARKNLGYLVAFSRHAPCIYETDDDNAPGATWHIRTRDATAQRAAPRPWVNVYRTFADEPIWPRGFPLELVSDESTWAHRHDAPVERIDAPIQLGLADLAPDVDAIWRLVMDRPVFFRPASSLWLPPGSWCPFNSQSSWWWPPAYPLMYLPSYCSFRMTDIWRSFVAQRCLWELGNGLVFHGPEVVQQRNPHDIMRDFEHELPGYLHDLHIAQILGDLELRSGPDAVEDNMARCYQALIAGGFLPAEELPLLHAWLADLADALGR